MTTGQGWFVVNARDGRWVHAEGRGARLTFDGEPAFPQLGISLYTLEPGEPMAMYHWEADQEDFLVLSGEALLIIESEERPLRRWDFVHCPPHTNHTIVGAGAAPCSRSAPASTKAHPAGAATPSTRPPCATARVSSARRTTSTRPTPTYRAAGRRPGGRAGCPIDRSRGRREPLAFASPPE